MAFVPVRESNHKPGVDRVRSGHRPGTSHRVRRHRSSNPAAVRRLRRDSTWQRRFPKTKSVQGINQRPKYTPRVPAPTNNRFSVSHGNLTRRNFGIFIDRYFRSRSDLNRLDASSTSCSISSSVYGGFVSPTIVTSGRAVASWGTKKKRHVTDSIGLKSIRRWISASERRSVPTKIRRLESYEIASPKTKYASAQTTPSRNPMRRIPLATFFISSLEDMPISKLTDQPRFRASLDTMSVARARGSARERGRRCRPPDGLDYSSQRQFRPLGPASTWRSYLSHIPSFRASDLTSSECAVLSGIKHAILAKAETLSLLTSRVSLGQRG